MASPEARRAARAARGEEAQDTATQEGEKKSLSDPQRQTEIENPKSRFITIGGAEVELHVLAFNKAKELAALAMDVMQDSGQELRTYDLNDEFRRTVMGAQRIASILQRPSYKPVLLRLIVHATAEPGEYSDATADVRAVAMDQKIEYLEQSTAFMVMVQMNDILEAHLKMKPKIKDAEAARPS
jgi:hypothetical protein